MWNIERKIKGSYRLLPFLPTIGTFAGLVKVDDILRSIETLITNILVNPDTKKSLEHDIKALDVVVRKTTGGFSFEYERYYGGIIELHATLYLFKFPQCS